jgi:hypothetical protein
MTGDTGRGQGRCLWSAIIQSEGGGRRGEKWFGSELFSHIGELKVTTD